LLEGESSFPPSLLHTGKIALAIHPYCRSRPQIDFAIPCHFNYGLTSTSGTNPGSLAKLMGSANTDLSPLKVNPISLFLNKK
jgi:hypothetical protein